MIGEGAETGTGTGIGTGDIALGTEIADPARVEIGTAATRGAPQTEMSWQNFEASIFHCKKIKQQKNIK